MPKLVMWFLRNDILMLRSPERRTKPRVLNLIKKLWKVEAMDKLRTVSS